jgi:hypothetical protein
MFARSLLHAGRGRRAEEASKKGEGTVTGLSNAAQWAALVGVVMPPLVALIQKEHWSDFVNSIVFGAACIGASFLVAWLDHQSDWTWANWRTSVLTIVFAGLAMYKLYWKPAGTIELARRGGPVRSTPEQVAASAAPSTTQPSDKPN